MKLAPTRYIPANSQEIVMGEGKLTVYLYEDNLNRPLAIAYIRKSNKPAWHIRFTDKQKREDRINQQYESIIKREADMIARRESRKQKHNVKVGDIFYTSWGYDQTNIDFYQVLSTTARTVTVQEIQGKKEYTGYLNGDVTALKDHFMTDTEVGKNYPDKYQPFTKVVNMNGQPSIKIASYAYGWLDDGRSHGFSEWA